MMKFKLFKEEKLSKKEIQRKQVRRTKIKYSLKRLFYAFVALALICTNFLVACIEDIAKYIPFTAIVSMFAIMYIVYAIVKSVENEQYSIIDIYDR